MKKYQLFLQKRKLACLILFSFLFSICMPTIANAQTDLSSVTIEEMLKISSRESGALKAYFQLRSIFEINDLNSVVGYPEGYAGCYIDNEYYLVIRTKTGYSDLKKRIDSCISPELPVKYQDSNFDIIELIKLADDFCSEHKEMAENTKYMYSSTRNALVLQKTINAQSSSANVTSEDIALNVAVSEFLEKHNYPEFVLEIEFLVNSSEPLPRNSDCVAGALMESFTNPNATIGPFPMYGGKAIYRRTSTGNSLSGSVGISGSFSSGGVTYAKCVLTAGHVADNSSLFFIDDGNLVSLTPLSYQFAHGEAYDWGVLSANNSNWHTLTNAVYDDDGTLSVPYYYTGSDYPELASVFKYGAVTGYTVGRVTYQHVQDPNYGTLANEIRIYGLYNVSPIQAGEVINEQGDSGGPVITIIDGDPVLLGVVSGFTYNNNGNVFEYMHVSPIHQAISAGFSPYNMSALSNLY